MTDVINDVKILFKQCTWLCMITEVFDVTIIGNEYDLLSIIKDEF